MKKYPDVDAYIADMKRWRDEAIALREVLSGCKLDEAIKWGKPCYGHEGKNVLIVQSMKNFLALLFVKGALVEDPKGLLEFQGPNSRSGKRLCFTSVAEVKKHKAAIRKLVRSAIEVEAQGKTLPKRPASKLAPELQARLDGDAKLAAAFEKLTPGRRREYNLFVSGAKQSKTRSTRVEKNVARILAGKGLRDR